MLILVVEHDYAMAEAVRLGLGIMNFCSVVVRSTYCALREWESGRYAAVLLDANLPDGNGLDLLARLRADGDTTPVIVMSGRSSKADKLRGLEYADDYVVKPFDLDELVARLKAVLRRSVHRTRAPKQIGNVVLRYASNEIVYEGQVYSLTEREFAIASCLVEAVGKVVNRDRIERSLFPQSELLESNALEVHIHNLRRKLGKSSINTVRGKGYRFGTIRAVS